MAGLTLDAGPLIALERNDRRAWAIFRRALERQEPITVPAPVVAQCWRGARSAALALALDAVVVEPLDEVLAKRAGEICGVSRTADVVDATVVASAARRRDDILTADVRDLSHLQSFVRRPGRLLQF